MDFIDRFDPEQFAADEPIEVYGYRGEVGHPHGQFHSVPEGIFLRLEYLGRAYRLHVLSAIDIDVHTELTKPMARTLAEELAFVSAVVMDPLVQKHAAGLQIVCDYCWQHPGEARVTIP